MGKLSQVFCGFESKAELWVGGWKELDDKFCGLSRLGSGMEQNPCLSKQWLSC